MDSSQREQDGAIVVRSPVLNRAIRAIPRLLVLTAPGGYGKTTTALEYAKVLKTSAVVDLSRTQSPRALLLALLKILVAGNADRAYLAQAQLSLAMDDAVPPALAERILDVWRDPGAPAVVVFDNAERMPQYLLPLLNQTLERRPAHRACVVCSRTPLALETSAIASPTETMTVSVEDLALSEDRTRALFADASLSEAQFRSVLDTAGGWPILTTLLRSLCTNGRLNDVLAHIDRGMAPDQKYELVQNEAIGLLSGPQRRALEFCASVPDVRLDDVETCLGPQAADALRAVARTLPLIQLDGDRVFVHELLAEPISQANQHTEEDLRFAARAALRRGNREAAAERYMVLGDRDEAANVLDDMLERGATAAVAPLAASLDEDILQRHPRWFVITAFLRRYDVPPAENLASIQTYRARVERTADEVARFAIGVVEAHQLLHCGMPEQARERLRELDGLVADLKRGGIVKIVRAHIASRFTDTLRAAMAVADGDPNRAERLLKRARFALGQFPLMTLSATGDGWLLIGLLRADIRLIREQCGRTRESLTRTGFDMVLLDLDANEAFAGWVLGDDAVYEESINRMDERARVYRTRAFDHLLGCAGLHSECKPTGVEPLRRLIIAHLLAAGRMNGAQGLQNAQRALVLARELRHALFTTLAAIAVRERGGDPQCTAEETLALAPRLEASLVERLRGTVPSRTAV